MLFPGVSPNSKQILNSVILPSFPTVCAPSCLTLRDPIDCSPPSCSVHGFPRQEYWSGLPFPSSGDLPFPGIDPASLASPALVEGSNWKEVKMSRNPVLLRATLPNVVWGEQKSPAPNILSLWHKNYLKLIIFLKSRQKKSSENQVEVTFS